MSISCKIFHQIRKGRLFHVFFLRPVTAVFAPLGRCVLERTCFGGSRIGYTFVYPNVLRFFHIFPQKETLRWRLGFSQSVHRSSLPHRCGFSRDGLDGICRHWTNCKNPLTPFKAAELTDWYSRDLHQYLGPVSQSCRLRVGIERMWVIEKLHSFAVDYLLIMEALDSTCKTRRILSNMETSWFEAYNLCEHVHEMCVMWYTQYSMNTKTLTNHPQPIIGLQVYYWGSGIWMTFHDISIHCNDTSIHVYTFYWV